MSADNPLRDPFTDPEHGLFELLLEQAGAIGELSRESDEYALKAMRFDEGVACLQWMCAKVERSSAGAGAASIKASVVLRCLDELVAFGSQGYEPGWLKAARAEMGRDR